MKFNQRQAETFLFDELLILNDNIVDVFAKKISVKFCSGTEVLYGASVFYIKGEKAPITERL